MKERKPKLSLLEAAVIALGAGLLSHSVYSLASAGLRANVGWMLLVPIIVGLAYFGTVSISGAKGSIAVNISDTVIFTSLVLFGANPALILASVEIAVQSLKNSKSV